MSTRLSRQALFLILASVVGAWVLIMVATYTDLTISAQYSEGMGVDDQPAVRASTYLFLAAVASVSAGALLAQRLAIRARLDAGATAALPRAAHRFATLTIVVSLAFAAIFAVSVFFQSFPGGREQAELGTRLFTTYLPIVLYTAIIVTALLVGFVFRTDKLPKTTASATPPESPSPHTEEDPSGASRALGGAYAVPIVAAAIALIFGLIVYDVTQTRLELWIWVIIQVIIASGIILGTVFAASAIQHEADITSSRSRITRSAGTLNFVLSVVFIAIVLGMGFGQGASSLESLRISPQLYVEVYPGKSDKVGDVLVSVNGWDLEPGTPVRANLDDTGDVLLSGEAGAFRDFYQQETLPDTLSAGDYRITGEATGIDGKELTSTSRFTVTEDLSIELTSLTGGQWSQAESTVLPIGWSWFVREMLAALTMLTIGLATAYLTITRRHRDHSPH